MRTTHTYATLAVSPETFEDVKRRIIEAVGQKEAEHQYLHEDKIVMQGVALVAEPKKFKTVCICGSSRFADIGAVKMWEFEKQGILAVGMNYLPGWYVEQNHKESGFVHHLGEKENVAHILDELHLRKIEMADFIYVLNVAIPGHENGYIGERTRIEIEHARKLGKCIQYMTPMP